MRRRMTAELGRVLVRAHPEQLGETLDRREWRAQLVGRVAEELAQALLGGVALAERDLDLGEHRVQGQAELAHLGLVSAATRRPRRGSPT